MAGGLLGLGVSYRNNALNSLGQAAQLEQARKQANRSLKMQQKALTAQNVGAGAGLGFKVGSSVLAGVAAPAATSAGAGVAAGAGAGVAAGTGAGASIGGGAGIAAGAGAGASTGAGLGAWAGPVGALIGAGIGLLVSELF